MLWRAVVLLGGAAFVAYRVALAMQILKAKRAGDVAREQRLRTHGFGVYRYAVAALLVFVVLLLLLVWSSSR